MYWHIDDGAETVKLIAGHLYDKGLIVGILVGAVVGTFVGILVGAAEEGMGVGINVGLVVGVVGEDVGSCVGERDLMNVRLVTPLQEPPPQQPS